jgi:F0F1-type ATP synthase assembly protein I
MGKVSTPVTTQSSSGKAKEQPADLSSYDVQRLFFSMGVDMSWRLALGVLIPIIGGAELDKVFKTSPVLLFIGLALAVVGAVITIRRTLSLANQNPAFNQPKRGAAK